MYFYLINISFQNISQNFRKWQILDGSEHFGRFGASVASVGDLDLDGYDELCVGEPYADEGRGRVLLFRGSSSGIIETPSQILWGVTYGAATAAFGFSIRSGDKDLDGNGYPDLLIGSPDSNSVIVIKWVKSTTLLYLAPGATQNRIHVVKFTKLPLSTHTDNFSCGYHSNFAQNWYFFNKSKEIDLLALLQIKWLSFLPHLQIKASCPLGNPNSVWPRQWRDQVGKSCGSRWRWHT